MTSWIIDPSPIAKRPGSGASAHRQSAATRPLRGRPGACLAAGALALIAGSAHAATDTRPLSPAQIALFETPHLANVDHPTTLQYRFERDGAGAFTDSVAERIEKIH